MIVNCWVDKTIGIIVGTVGGGMPVPAEGVIDDPPAKDNWAGKDCVSKGKLDDPTDGDTSSTYLPVYMMG